MFVVLEARDCGGFMGRIFKPGAHTETREAFGARYGAIVLHPPVKARDWNRILALAGRYSDRLLLPSWLTPPPEVTPPSFPKYDRLVILKTAMEIIKLSRMPMYRRIAGLVDEKGEYADFLYPLLHHYTSVKVLTDNTGLYEQESAKMMYELGAPVLLAKDYSAFSDCALIVAPHGIRTAESLKCPVISKNPPASAQFSDFITDLRVAPSADAREAFPEGIDYHAFLAALYEYCGVEAVCLAASRMIFKYRECDIGEVVSAVVKVTNT